ncbi:hypothetical protein GCM10008931_38570 [Oceanobacillus oncorhynchi subsp. oncorhynchi]
MFKLSVHALRKTYVILKLPYLFFGCDKYTFDLSYQFLFAFGLIADKAINPLIIAALGNT